jgi:hypothetical protein
MAKQKKKLPLWAVIVIKIMKVLAIPILSAAALITGLMIGYVVIGDQQSPEVWQWSTWKHLYDLVFAD